MGTAEASDVCKRVNEKEKSIARCAELSLSTRLVCNGAQYSCYRLHSTEERGWHDVCYTQSVRAEEQTRVCSRF